MCAAVAIDAHASLADAATAMAPSFETIEPDPGITVYDDYFERYLEVYRDLKGTMQWLSTEGQKP